MSQLLVVWNRCIVLASSTITLGFLTACRTTNVLNVTMLGLAAISVETLRDDSASRGVSILRKT
jgi:hypothetical protein